MAGLFCRESLGLDRSCIPAFHLIFQNLKSSPAGQILLLHCIQPVLGNSANREEIDIPLISALLQLIIIAGLQIVGFVGGRRLPGICLCCSCSC